MKKLIFRNIVGDILVFFMVTSLAITLIVWVVQGVQYLDIVSEDGHGFKVYFMFTLLNLPKIFSKLIIFIFFISVFFIVSKYQSNNEILVFWSYGINKITFIKNIILFSLLFFLFQIILNLSIVPKSQDMARSFLRSSNIDYFPSLINEKRFIDAVDNLTIFVENKNENGYLNNIFLKDKFSQNKSKIIASKSGRIIKKNDNFILVLNNGKVINIDKNKTNVLNFKKSEFNLSNYSTNTITHPKVQDISSLEIFNCIVNYSKNKMGYKNEFLTCNKDSIDAFVKEIYNRALIPFYLILVSIIACLIISKSKDEYNYERFKYSTFLIGILVIILSEVSKNYIAFENKSNIAIVLFPILLIILLYSFLLVKFKFKT